MLRLALAACLALWTGGCSLFGGLDVQALDASTQKPSQVALYVAVTDGNEPVTDLEPKSFTVYENEEALSARQIERVLLARETVTEERVLLLVDLSGNPSAELREQLARAVEAFVRKLSESRRVSVRAYDGSETLKLVGEYARGSSSANAAAVTKLAVKDPSRNLHGAVTAGLAELDRALASEKKPIKLGTLVVFARGPDLAGRTSDDQMFQALAASKHDVIGVGIGEDTPYLGFARGGEIQAQSIDTLPIAFEEAGSRVAKTHGKYYLVAYCSPARSGMRRLRLEVSYTTLEGEEKRGSVTHDFDATGFGPGCRSDAVPRFERQQPKPAQTPAAPAPARTEPDPEPPAEPADDVVPPPASGDYAK